MIHFASQKGNLNIIKYLVEECGADPNTKNNYGFTPLQYASKNGYSDVVKYLESVT